MYGLKVDSMRCRSPNSTLPNGALMYYEIEPQLLFPI